MTHLSRYQQAKRITLWGAVMNVLLGIAKILGGIFFHSHALLADGIHSFSDIITDVTVLLASKYGSQAADASHPYGHQRIETAAVLLLAILLLLVGIGIVWDSIDMLFYHAQSVPSWPAMLLAVLSVFINESLFHITHRIGKRIQSAIILANAWHHRSDAASSFIVILGLIGAMLGWTYLDAVAAMIVGCFIIKLGINYGWKSILELVDTSPSPELISKITALIESVSGVEKIHQLRSRFMGHDLLIDVHILVAPTISVSEGHYIAQHVHRILKQTLPRIKDVVVHVDPEDDEITKPSIDLPNRETLEHDLILPWQKDYPFLSHWVLHYLEGNVIIDLIHEPSHPQHTLLEERIASDVESYTSPITIRLFSQHLSLDKTAVRSFTSRL